MKHIANVLKSEIFNQNSIITDLIKKVTVSQDSYLKDRNNEAFFNIWLQNVKELQQAEANIRALKSAYVTICKACGIEPQTVNEIIAEKSEKKARKPRAKKSQNVEQKEESQN